MHNNAGFIGKFCHVMERSQSYKSVWMNFWDSLVAQRVKRLPAIWETWVRSLGREDPLEKEMATHSLPGDSHGQRSLVGIIKSRTWPRDFTSLSLEWISSSFNSVQSLSCVWLFVTLWTGIHARQAHQASLSITNSGSLLKLMFIESVMPSNYLILCCPLLLQPSNLSQHLSKSFPASGSFPRSQFFASGGQSIGVSASASVLPMNTQDWSPLGWTGWISLQSKGLSRVCSNTTVQKHRFFGAQLSL